MGARRAHDRRGGGAEPYDNITITGLSAFVAFFIGTVEFPDLVGQEAGPGGPVWHFFAGFNSHAAGFVIVGVFVVTWAVAPAIWRLARIEDKWGAAAPRAADVQMAVE